MQKISRVKGPAKRKAKKQEKKIGKCSQKIISKKVQCLADFDLMRTHQIELLQHIPLLVHDMPAIR